MRKWDPVGPRALGKYRNTKEVVEKGGIIILLDNSVYDM